MFADGVAEEHKDVPDTELGRKGDGVAKQGQVPFCAERHVGDTELFETAADGGEVGTFHPALVEFFEGVNQAIEASGEECGKATELKETDEHDEGEVFIKVAK